VGKLEQDSCLNSYAASYLSFEVPGTSLVDYPRLALEGLEKHMEVQGFVK